MAVPDSDRARDDAALFERMWDPSDPLCREDVVQRYLPLARSLARALCSGQDTFDDAYQVACLGLVKAVDRFSVGHGVAFSSYAVPTMSGEIKRYYRDRTWMIRPPRRVQELSVRAVRARTDLAGGLRREPTVIELAERLDVSEEDALEALCARSARYTVSLDGPAAGRDEPGSSLGELIGRDDPRLAGVEDRATFEALISVLPTRARAIVRERFVHGLTQSEIGKLHGRSQMQVSRILHQALERLRVLNSAAEPRRAA